MTDTKLKSMLRAIIGKDTAPLSSLQMMADAGELTHDYQAAVAEHYGLRPTDEVLAALRELAAVKEA